MLYYDRIDVMIELYFSIKGLSCNHISAMGVMMY